MKEGFRQSMAWLHTWSGLLVGWVLFMVFAGGTSAYFRDEISLWMKPELHAATAAPPAVPAQAVALALRHLQDKAAGSPRWSIELPSEREPLLRTGWTVPQAAASAPRTGERPRRARFASATLDPATGQPVAAPRETRGGDFFYRLHFDLHYMSAIWGRWIVGFCAMFMLVAIVSGIVTHKRIFKDFFTFRPKKGQRSWLDAHNATAVLALPYHLMITYTGLVTLMFLYMPWGQEAVYRDDRTTFIAEVFPSSAGFSNQKAAGVPAPLVPVEPLMREASTAWHGAAVSRVVVNNPGDATARVTLYRHEGGKLSANQSSMTFDGASGRLLGRAGEDIAPASDTRGVLYGLHLGRFAHPLLRWLFFASGVAGCVMVATGLLLWSVKERQKYAKALARGGRVGWGLRLVDGLNVGAIAGLPLAMAVFFWANRFVPAGIAERPATEIACFFWAWGLAAVAGLAWQDKRMWQVQLALGGLLFALLPVLNPLSGGMGLLASLPAGEWRIAGFDLTAFALGAGLLAAAWYVGKRKPTAKARAAAAHAKAEAEANLLAAEPRLEPAGAGR